MLPAAIPAGAILLETSNDSVSEISLPIALEERINSIL